MEAFCPHTPLHKRGSDIYPTSIERGVFVKHTLTRLAVPSGLLCSGLLCASPLSVCVPYVYVSFHDTDVFYVPYVSYGKGVWGERKSQIFYQLRNVFLLSIDLCV